MGDQLRAPLHDAVSSAIGQFERGLLTKWVVVAETIDEAGDRGLWIEHADGMHAWETLGMLEYAKVVEAKAIED